MSKGRVVVTGGAGFIGSHLSTALLEHGWRVTVYDDLSTGRRENLNGEVELVEGDIRDTERLAESIAGATAVFHLAARVSVRDSLRCFADDADVNVLGTLRVLQACRAAPPERLILASSMAVYADSPTPDPVPESHTAEPISPYGVSKLAAERYCLQVCPQMGIRPLILRFFNTYGTRQTDTPYVGVISIFIRRLLRGEAPVVFGSGEQCRDFVHVSDIVAANLLALETGAASCVCNVGTGRATSVNEIARLLCARIAPQTEPLRSPGHAGELQNCVADVTAARRVLGYAPRARLADRIDEVIDHLRHERA